jgi:hypothetical protein
MKCFRISGVFILVILLGVSLLPLDTHAQVRSTPVTVVNTPLPVTGSEPTRDSVHLLYTMPEGRTSLYCFLSLAKPAVIESVSVSSPIPLTTSGDIYLNIQSSPCAATGNVTLWPPGDPEVTMPSSPAIQHFTLTERMQTFVQLNFPACSIVTVMLTLSNPAPFTAQINVSLVLRYQP